MNIPKVTLKYTLANLFQGGSFASCTINPSGEIIQITLITMSVKKGKNPINFFRKLMNFVGQVRLLQNKAWVISNGNGFGHQSSGKSDLGHISI